MGETPDDPSSPAIVETASAVVEDVVAIAAQNSKGILAMLASMAFFIGNDTLVKLASQNLPTGEIIFLRGLMASALVLVVARLAGAVPRPELFRRPAIALRIVGELGATVFYLTALFRMPIANVTALLQAVPLGATVAAVLFLGERVGWRRWLAVLAGLVGVLLIVRPGFADFNSASLIALLSVAFIVLRDLATRRVPATIPSLALTALTAMSVTFMGAIMVQYETYVPPTTHELMLLAGAAVFLNGGYFFIVVAMRSGEMSVVAPFRYSVVLWAIAIGWIIWGDLPTLAGLIGIAIVTIAGIYTFVRERKARPAAPPK
ncbi:MAG: DMT family transporter [Hyphomicrobiales bacterium]